MSETYVNHPLIQEGKIQARVYQQLLFAKAIKANTLIVLPTGLGKTIIIVMVIAHYLKNIPDQKVIITAPTRPLVDQHFETCRNLLNISQDQIQIMSGTTSPEERISLWREKSVFISTPQTLRNDIINQAVDLTKISLICFDEAHRAVGEDPYVLTAEQFTRANPSGRKLGFTASPGKDVKLKEVIQNLGLQALEHMDEDHPQVKPYIHDTEENWIWVELPEELKGMIQLLEDYTKQNLQILKEIGVVDSIQLSNNPKRKILSLPSILNKNRENMPDEEFYAGMSAYGQLMLITQASEMLETQGMKTLQSYIQDKIDEFQRTKKNSLRRFLQAKQVKEAFELVNQLISSDLEHPKLTKLRTLVEEELQEKNDTRILVFANYKATAQYLTNQLNLIPNVRAHRFVGQSSSNYGKGLTQKRQKEVMDHFRSGEYNLLVSTSVGEEGLDVAQCDLVVFYDVTPSATRLIQRSGRTGRARAGKVVILITKGTRDEGYFYASKRQKSKIKSSITKVQNELAEKTSTDSQQPLSEFFSPSRNGGNADISQQSDPVETDLDFSAPSPDQQPLIYIDYRERGASLLRNLMNADVEIKQTTLPIGDFVVSDRVAVERKTIEDFKQTLTRGDLFDQLKSLKIAYQKPLLLIEGEDVYRAGLHPAAIRGAIASILIDYSIPILFAKDEEETVKLLVSIAKREQKEKSNRPQIRADKPSGSLEDEQIYLISSLPNIDRVLAERILTQFNTPRAVFNASQDELRKVYGIGPQIADRIDILLNSPFKDEE